MSSNPKTDRNTTAAPEQAPVPGPPDPAIPHLEVPAAPQLDAAIADLRRGSTTWAHLTLDQRRRLLGRVRDAVGAVSEQWATTAAASKGLDENHPLRGEEWLSGPYATLTALDAYSRTLGALAEGKTPLDGLKTAVAPGARVRVKAFPFDPIDGLLLSGYSGEVWLKPGVTRGEAERTAGLAQLTPTESGGVGLVLGAGNVTSIPVLDALYELLSANRTVILKLNPTQDALLPAFERALAPLIEPGFVRIVTGGGDVGSYLAEHEGIDHVHITGAAATFNAIVWGTGADAAERRKDDKPLLTKPITAELGGVSPIIVVPGEWSDADLKYHAENITTMRLYNSGHNCIAGQVVIVSRDWAQRDHFLDMLQTAYESAPKRSVWYPRSDERLADAASDYPSATWSNDGCRALIEVGERQDATALEQTEYFAPVLGVVDLAGNGQVFLDAAVAHANTKLAGTLGANVLIDPATEAALGSGFERAISQLHYGAIAINAWTALTFLTPTLTWGGYPGATLENVESGIGVVHNALLLADVERSVSRGPFRPFPRSAAAVLRPGVPSVLPKPPWFVTSRTGAEVSEGLTRFRVSGSWPGLMATLAKAFRA